MDIPIDPTASRPNDDRLGLHEPITRRDFVNGALVAGAGLLLSGRVAGAMSPADDWNGYGGVGQYRHSNGNTYDVMNAAHGIRDGAYEGAMAKAIDTGEVYDLVSVGRRHQRSISRNFPSEEQGRARKNLDNHSMVGGLAERNEFLVDGIASPRAGRRPSSWSQQKNGYIDKVADLIGMDRSVMEYQHAPGLTQKCRCCGSLRRPRGRLLRTPARSSGGARGVGARSAGTATRRGAIERGGEGRLDALAHRS